MINRLACTMSENSENAKYNSITTLNPTWHLQIVCFVKSKQILNLEHLFMKNDLN